MRHLVPVADVSYSGASEYRADGSALMKHDSHDPSEELRAAWPYDHLAARPLRKRQSPACACPQPNAPTERPQIDEENQCICLTADRRDEVLLDNV